MQRVNRFDRGQLSQPRRLPNGFLRAEGYLTRTGIFDYRRADGSVKRELRLPEEILSHETLDSLAMVPITNEHPPELLTADNSKKYAVGTVGESVRADDGFVRSSLILTDAQAIAEVEAGKRELSCGYTLDLDETPGEWNGQRYDAIQRNVRGNHVAIVANGRAGEACAIRMDACSASEVKRKDEMVTCPKCGEKFDPEMMGGMPEGETEMETLDVGGVKMDAAQVLALKAERDQARARLDSLESEAVQRQMRDKIASEVRQRIELENHAKRLDVAIAETESIDDVRRKLIVKMDSTARLDGASSEYLRGRLDVLLQVRADQQVAQVRVAGQNANFDSADDPAEAARKEMIAHNASLGKGK